MYATSQPSITVNTGTLAGILVAAALATSSIVFSEPAIADVIMMGVIVGVPLLGVGRLGPAASTNLALWLVVIAFGVLGTTFSTTFSTAFPHQLVTLFLALGAAVLASYVAADAIPRFHLIMTCYVAGALIATAAGMAGYFNILPSTYDLFTIYGRARGTFKDPNVLGAALAPAIVYTVWVTLKGRLRYAIPAALAGGLLALGALITYSRGAWISIAFSLAATGWLVLISTRTGRDRMRFTLISMAALAAMVVGTAALLRVETVSRLITERANLDQSYDQGPEGRFGGQRKAIRLILDNPLGIGTHTFRDTYHPEEAHNVYLSTFLNAGWVGGLFYIASIVITLVLGILGALRNGPMQGPLIVAGTSFAGVAFEGLVIDTDHWRHFFILLGLVWGLTDAARHARDKGTR